MKSLNIPPKIFFILFLLMSFGTTVSLFLVPVLPAIAQYFDISSQHAKLMVSLAFIGVLSGHLMYGPLANRFGRKKTLQMGLALQVSAALLALGMIQLHSFNGLLLSKILLALGAAAGVKLSYTMIGDLYHDQNPTRILALTATSFAILPGLGIYGGSIVMQHFGWEMNFLSLAFYGGVMLFLVSFLPETYSPESRTPFRLKTILAHYQASFTHKNILILSVMWGLLSTIGFSFPAFSAFIGFKILHLTPNQFGLYSQLPSLGILLGNLSAAVLSRHFRIAQMMKWGLLSSFLSAILFVVGIHKASSAGIFFGGYAVMQFFMSYAFVGIPASLLRESQNVSTTSASMNFLFMLVVWILLSLINHYLSDNPLFLAWVFLILMGAAIGLFGLWARWNASNNET